MRGHECPHDGQAEAGTGRVGTRVDAGELLEDVVAFRVGHAGPVVGDAYRDAGRICRRLGRHQDLGTGWREAQGVLEQVAEHLLHHLDVDLDVADVGRHVEPDAVGAGKRTEPADRSLREVAQVDRLAPHVERPGADATQFEDVGDEPLEPFGLVVDGVEQLGAVGRVEIRARVRAALTTRP